MESPRRSRNRRRAPQGVAAADAKRTAPNPAPTRAGDDLHVCPRCCSPLVQPLEWSAVDSRRWRVDLFCPECEWRGGGVFSQSVLDRFDEQLDEGAAALVRDLHALAQENMREDVDTFSAALDAGLIQPDDF